MSLGRHIAGLEEEIEWLKAENRFLREELLSLKPPPKLRVNTIEY